MDISILISQSIEWSNKRLEILGEPITEKQKEYLEIALKSALSNFKRDKPGFHCEDSEMELARCQEQCGKCSLVDLAEQPLNEKKLLVDFFIFFRNNGEDLIGLTIEDLVETFFRRSYTPKEIRNFDDFLETYCEKKENGKWLYRDSLWSYDYILMTYQELYLHNR